MHEGLLTFIRKYQEPISESLKKCDTEITYQDDSLDELLELAKTNINVFPFSSVKPCWFQLYANVSIAKATEYLQKLDLNADAGNKEFDETFAQVVASLDNALIIAGGGDGKTRNLIHEILWKLDRILRPNDILSDTGDDLPDLSDDDVHDQESRAPPTKKRRLNTIPSNGPPSHTLPTNLAFVPKLKYPIPNLNNPSLTTFESQIHKSNTPLIIKNTLTHWPALTKWHDANYWLRRTLNGHRLVPIELGQSYTDEGWRQEIMTFNCFLNEYILKGDDAEEIGYLAQHDLFNQIPGLRADVTVPDYCFADMPDGVDRGDGSYPKRDTKKGGGSVEKQESRTIFISSGTTMNQTPAETSIRAEDYGTSDKATTPDPPTTDLQQKMHDHDTDQLDVNPLSHVKVDSNPSPFLSDSSLDNPPPQIHQNIWFGTRTVTPLHHDPYSNILTQIHGTKYIRLYSPAYTTRLYPRSAQEVAPHVSNQSDSPQNQNQNHRADHDDQPPDNHTDSNEHTLPQEITSEPTTATIDMSNTSTIPLWSIEQSPHEDWDEQYPGFSSVPYVEGLLEAGDAVYIPKGWWHYVRGVSAVGIGVSFWW